MKICLKILLNILFITLFSFRLEAVDWGYLFEGFSNAYDKSDNNFSIGPVSPTWGPVDTISPSYFLNDTPKIASDPNGNAMAVWTANTGTGNTQILASHYTASIGWDASPTPLSQIGGNAIFPYVAMDDQGNAMAIWERTNGTTMDVQMAFYSQLKNSWSIPLKVSPFMEDAIMPKFAFDSSGNGIAIWNNTYTSNIQTIHYVQATNTWSEVTNISDEFIPIMGPHLAVNSSGKAIVVWLADTGTHKVVQTNTYNGISWGTPTTISNDLLNALNVSIGIDNAGNGIAVWGEIESSQIISGSYDQTLDIWSIIPVSPSTQIASNPSVAVDPLSGDALAVWSQYDGIQNWAQGATYNFSTLTWSSPTTLSNLGEYVVYLKALVDSRGNGIAFWRSYKEADFMIGTAFYDVFLSTWSGAQTLATSGIKENPDICIHPSASKLFAIWSFTSDNKKYVIQTMIGS